MGSDVLTVIGKERKNETIKTKNLADIQDKFQSTDTLETKEKDKLESTQRSKTVCSKSSIKKKMGRKEVSLHFS